MIDVLDDGSEGTSEVVRLLRWLVQQESTTGGAGERRALAAVAERMRELVGASGVVSVAPDRDACLVRPTTDGGPVLLFACHVDTVPVGDPERWTHPPLSARIVDGLLHGRGSSDMKAGLAAAMCTVADGLAAGARVALAVTTGEEAGCLGAPSAAQLLAGTDVAAVVIPESTGNRIALGHRGAYWLTVSAAGVAAHGSTPERGRNAVLALASTLGELESLPLRRHDDLGTESVNVGVFSGGLVHNIVPAHASAAVDHRIVRPDASALHAWWAERVDEVRVDLELAPVWSSSDDAWIRRLPAAVSPDPVAYFTDASVLVGRLPEGTPIVVWGPGDPAVVHSVDEHVAVTAVEEALSLFRRAVADWPSAGAASDSRDMSRP
ncbi:M20 family metallopeptidase [Microbacterium sp. 18062]|uniref:M20 family metallopeptidase n=1 Tax=Microbacterium sp. 18062 TaxID=2681410 RepID=UPI001359C87A|nr:M20/M25/M40 family metallo-hydrolase [Microbacterium sp. 18062]